MKCCRGNYRSVASGPKGALFLTGGWGERTEVVGWREGQRFNGKVFGWTLLSLSPLGNFHSYIS